MNIKTKNKDDLLYISIVCLIIMFVLGLAIETCEGNRRNKYLSDDKFCKYISSSNDAVMIDGYCYWSYNAGCEHFLRDKNYYDYKIFGGLKSWANNFKINNTLEKLGEEK